MTPRAPDADEYDERTIKLAYDACRRRFTASLVREDDLGRNETVLWAWQDHDPLDGLETLKSWAILIESVPYLPDGQEVECVKPCHYLLHDTREVRAILKKLDTEQGRRLTDWLKRIMDTAAEHNWVPCHFTLGPEGWDWIPIPLGQLKFVKQ